MNTILHDKIEQLKELCRQYKVKSLYSFGSVNTAKFTKDSDIDLLIEFDSEVTFEEYADNYFSFREKLVELFRRKIDLVTQRSLSNPFFIADVEHTKQLLYGA